MSQNNTPWLAGLDGTSTWNTKPPTQAPTTRSSASHDATSLLRHQPRLARRSLSGNSMNSLRKARSPLAPLEMNGTSVSGRTESISVKESAQFVSEDGSDSDNSIARCGTVQQRSKSSSPLKTQASLEWRKRLLHGKLGYGDQTDLFGPSGLENIFAPSSKGADSDGTRHKKRMNWMPRSDVSMPSSPPPWPLSRTVSNGEHEDRRCASQRVRSSGLDSLDENEGSSLFEETNSLRSNPFDLAASDSVEKKVETSASEIDVSHEHPENLGNRTIGGPTELEQEDFSPVFVSKHTTVNGKVDYAAVDSHTIRQLKESRLDAHRKSQKHTVANDEEENALDHAENMVQNRHPDESVFTDGPESESVLAPAHDLSLSENLPTGTPEPLGRFVQLQRGGYSTQGSFRNRLLSVEHLSPGNTPDHQSSELPQPDPSMLLHPPPPVPTPPATTSLQSPHRREQKQAASSPLRLFGPHDTFTSNRLLRRMSELSPDVEAVREATVEARRPSTNGHIATPAQTAGGSRQTSFGVGELNDHDFAAEITITHASSDESELDSEQSPNSDVPVPGSKFPMSFKVESSPSISGTSKLKRRASDRSYSSHRASESILDQGQEDMLVQTTLGDGPDPECQRAQQHVHAEATAYYENKRPPSSPAKDPTPKRRRTLHASELVERVQSALDDAITGVSVNHAPHEHTEITSWRKDVLSQAGADEESLAQHRIARPRNPTPSQGLTSGHTLALDLRDATDDFLAQEDRTKVEEIFEQVEQSLANSDITTIKERAEAVAEEVAKFTLRIDKAHNRSAHGERKRSVTTQDFFREAECVMEYIRARAGKKRSVLSSVAEADNLDEDVEEDPSRLTVNDVQEPIGYLRVSREPSWEGRPRSRWREPEQSRVQRDGINLNRVASQLNKWKESDDEQQEAFIAASTLAETALDHATDGAHEDYSESEVVVNEHAKIRITIPSAEQAQQNTYLDSRPDSQRSAESTTGSTKKSDNVGTLAPDAVAHLIGSEVGGMTFDREKQRWVRLRAMEQKAENEGLLDVQASHLTSEDDPFREISDLPVDEGIERRRISSPARLDAAQQPDAPEVSAILSLRSDIGATFPNALNSRTSSQDTVVRPHPQESKPPHRQGQTRSSHKHSSSAPSKRTWISDDATRVETDTRATSWSSRQSSQATQVDKTAYSPRRSAAPETSTTSEIAPTKKEEKSADSGLHSPSFTEPANHTDAPDNVDDHRTSDSPRGNTVLSEMSDLSNLHSSRIRESAPQRENLQLYPQTERSSYKHFASCDREQSEISIVAPLHGDRMISLSLSVSKPIVPRHQQISRVFDPQSSPLKGNSTFLLSDLPDFTVHEADEETPSERALASRLAQHAAAEVDDRYALARKDLVKTLTDVYPGEPYWDDLRVLDLRQQSLTSLHGLDGFCSAVRGLNVSSNNLTQLEGTPSTVRYLAARGNQLSDVTSFGHLANLQYVDLSGNDLRSLRGLSNLIHMREFRADDNNIDSLHGLNRLDGLLNLRCRRNGIHEISLAAGDFERLVTLDISRNDIGEVRGLEHLGALETLKLDGNPLKPIELNHALPTLKHLSLRSCGLSILDVSSTPNLQTLDVDDNSLTSIIGLAELKHLQVLSMRRQTLPEGHKIDIFQQRLEAHTAHLSGNALPSLSLDCDLLSLKYLELAACGLQHLPADFGIRLPNLRKLNLNFNRLQDTRPLLNLNCLGELMICGNRLGRLRRTVATFAKMPGLKMVDLRDNPISQGFYAHVGSNEAIHTKSLTLVKKTQLQQQEEEEEVDEDEQQALAEAARHVVACRETSPDKLHFARLDEDTKLRRRVYEMLIAHSCKTLAVLDGSAFDIEGVLVKDGVWNRLVELGIVRRSGDA